MHEAPQARPRELAPIAGLAEEASHYDSEDTQHPGGRKMRHALGGLALIILLANGASAPVATQTVTGSPAKYSRLASRVLEEVDHLESVFQR